MTRRLLLAMTALVAAVALALAIPLSIIVDRDQRAAFVASMEVDTLAAATALAAQPTSGWPELVVDIADRTGARVVAVGQDRLLLADSDQTALDRSFDRVEIDRALSGDLASDVRYSQTLAEDLRYVAAPVVQDGGIVAAVRLTLPDSEVDALVRRTQVSLLVFMVAVIAAAALVAWLIARSIVAPLSRVAVVADDLADDLSLRADPDSGPSEVRSVARSLNRTAARLSDLVTRQERVAEDASHHLRTPLTGVRLRLEAIEDVTDEASTREQATAALVEVDRLTRRIEQILELARADAGQQAGRVDVGVIVADRIAAIAALADDRGIEIGMSRSPGTAWAMAPLGVIDRVVDELLGNALAYARREISVTVDTTDGTLVELSVGDDGPGIAPEDRERVFERFVRARDAVRGGSGLGLALVREAARAAGGDAVAQASPAGGLLVRTTWPAAD